MTKLKTCWDCQREFDADKMSRRDPSMCAKCEEQEYIERHISLDSNNNEEE